MANEETELALPNNDDSDHNNYHKVMEPLSIYW